MGFPFWAIPIGLQAIGGIGGMLQGNKDADAINAANQAYYEEQKKAQAIQRAENIMRGGLGGASPIKPPTEVQGPSIWDALAGIAPTAAYMYGKGGQGDANNESLLRALQNPTFLALLGMKNLP